MPLLTDKEIRSLQPKEKSYKVFDTKGLYIEILPSGKKFWRYRYKYNNKETRKSLGEYPAISLKEARDLRDDFIKNGVVENKKIPTFKEVGEQWEEIYLIKKAPMTIKRDTMLLKKYIYPSLGRFIVSDISSKMILNLLLFPMVNKGIIDSAHKAKDICSQIFRLAIIHDYFEYNPIYNLKDSLPAKKVKHRSTLLKSEDISLLLKSIWNYEGNLIVKKSLQILPFVFVRPQELRLAKWDEFNFNDALWSIPAERMKMKNQHLVPLSPFVIDLLKDLKNITGAYEYLFPGSRGVSRPISNMSMNVALKTLGFSGDQITPHGFRAMASTILNMNNFNSDWIEKQLAHTSQNAVRASYNHADYLNDRRIMMLWWSDYLSSLLAC